MTNSEPRKSPNAVTKLLRGIATLGVLAVVSIVIFFIWLDNEFDRPQEEALAMSRRLADKVAQQLKTDSMDGQITDQEITETLRQHQSELRSLAHQAGRTVFVAAMHGSSSGPLTSVGGTLCFEFTLVVPSAAESVSYRELRECPPL